MVARGVRGCWGECVVAPWGGECVVALRGMRGFFQGVCVVFSGGAWFFPGGGVCGFFRQGGVHVFFWGACVVLGGACIGYDEIRSMSGRYASYWNAFL